MEVILYIDDLYTYVTLEESEEPGYFYVQNNETKEYYSAHDNKKHVYYTKNRYDWERWSIEEIDGVKILRSYHGTHLKRIDDTIWQTNVVHSLDKLVKISLAD